MILCEWDAPEGHPGQSCVHLFARILSTSFTSVSILSVCCYSRVSISMNRTPPPHPKNSAGIFKQSMGDRNQEGIGLLYRPARLHNLAELVLWNRFWAP